MSDGGIVGLKGARKTAYNNYRQSSKLSDGEGSRASNPKSGKSVCACLKIAF